MIKKWTAAEDKQALKLADSGKSLADIASTLGRTENSIRNRLYELRKGKRGSESRPSHVVIKLTAEQYSELLHGAETAKENERLVERQRLTYEDYCSLYAVCQKLLKQYKNHRNTKAGFEELEREMELRMPCPF